MKEVFFTLGVIVLLHRFGLPFWLILAIVAGLLTFDLWLNKRQVKDLAQLEAFKLYIGKK